MRRAVVTAVLLGGLVGLGCSGTTNTFVTKGVFQVDPATQVTFSDTCVTPSDPQYTITPPTGTVTISNVGNGLLSNLSVAVAPNYKDIFTVQSIKLDDQPQTAMPTDLPSGSVLVVTYQFLPTASGSSIGKLTITGDNIASGEPTSFEITMMGTAKDLPPTPSISLSCPPGDAGMFNKDKCALWPGQEAQLLYKETVILSERVFDVAVTNNGCPDLKLTDFQIVPDPTEGTPHTGEDAFTIVDGLTSLTVAGSSTAHFKVQYMPTIADASLGYLKMKTNDPQHPDLQFKLQGNGSDSKCRIETGVYCNGTSANCCDYKDLAQPCTGTFTIRNTDYTNPMTVTSVSLKNGGQNGMFTMTAEPDANSVIPAGAGLTDSIVVAYAASEAFKSDFIVVDTDLGKCQLELRGGSPPVIETDPIATLEFGTLLPANSVVSKTLIVKNIQTYNQQLPLTVSDWVIKTSDGNVDLTFFQVIPATGCSDIADGESLEKTGSIAPGAAKKLCIQLSTKNGTMFNDMMSFATNDPNYPPTTTPPTALGYIVTLFGTTECHVKPTAVMTAIDDPNPTTPCSGSCANGGVCFTDGLCHRSSLTFTYDGSDPDHLKDTFYLSAAMSYEIMPDPNDRSKCDNTQYKSYDQIDQIRWFAADLKKSNPNVLDAVVDSNNMLKIQMARAATISVDMQVVDKMSLASQKLPFTVKVVAAQ